MSRPPILVGEFEQLILLAVLQCGEDAYTVPVRQIVAERAGRRVARGAVHTALDRLEAKGLLKSRLGEPLAVRGGRARRFYRVTASGLASVRAARAALLSLSAGLEHLLDPRP
jgi:PadR family transcriptional regulator PadR